MHFFKGDVTIMNEKLAKKLAKILAKAGLDEDQVNNIISEVEEAVAEEVTPDGGNPDPNAQVPPSDENGNDVPPAPEGDVPPSEVVPPIPNEEVVPQDDDGSIDSALAQLAAQEQGVTPPTDVPPTPDPNQGLPPTPPIPQVDPTKIEQLINDLGEANKTIEALSSRINSLEEALKSAGVITSNSALGDETPHITKNASADQVDAFDDILNVINGK